MKKVFLSLSLIVAILAVSCKGETKGDTTEASEKVEATEEKASEEKTEKAEETSSEAASGVPSFSNKDVQDYVNSYEAYIEEYKKAAESKDMTAFASLGQKGQELGQKAQEVMGNLSAEDVKKLNDYMMEKSTQLQELSKKLTQ